MASTYASLKIHDVISFEISKVTVDKGAMHCKASMYQWIFTTHQHALIRLSSLAFHKKIIKLPATLQITVLLYIVMELIELQKKSLLFTVPHASKYSQNKTYSIITV